MDEFLFHLKKKPGEGPTAFVSRFKAVLSRLEMLIAADKAVHKGTKRRKPQQDPEGSSTESSDISCAPLEEPGLTEEKVKGAAAEGNPSASAGVEESSQHQPSNIFASTLSDRFLFSRQHEHCITTTCLQS